MNFIEFKDNEIILFVPKGNKAQRWNHQYYGVLCYQFEMNGEIIHLGFSKHRYFKPDWWYGCIMWIEDGVVESRKVKNWDKIDSNWDSEKIIKFENDIKNNPHKILYSDMKKDIEIILNKLNKDYSFIIKDEKIREALIKVDYSYKNKPYREGFIMWQNCD